MDHDQDMEKLKLAFTRRVKTGRKTKCTQAAKTQAEIEDTAGEQD